MQSSRETKIFNLSCSLLVLSTGFLRFLSERYLHFCHNNVIFIFYTAALFIWICQIQRRLLQTPVRRNLTLVASLMIFWMVIRTVKYELLPENHITNRYAWYLYYIPLIFSSLLMFLSVLYIGRPYDRPISSWWRLLYIPAFLLFLGILTNDFHQIAFRFPEGIENWAATDDSIHGPIYYGVVAWMVILFVAVIAIVFVRCAVPANRKKIWVPFLPFFIGVVYTVYTVLDQHSWIKHMFKLPEIGCFLFGAFMESLIIVGLFPSNDNYGDFFNASSIGAGIMDADGVIRYKSAHSIDVDEEQIREGEYQEVLIEDGNFYLKSHKIKGGFGYWTKDISEIHRLNQQLEDLGNVLLEENAMIDAENRIAEERTRIRQQNELYNHIANSVRPQLDKISVLLKESTYKSGEFEQRMKYACILNAYIKRYSNLLLLSYQNGVIDADELRFAISESLDYVRLYGVKEHLSYEGKGKFGGECILFLYEVFEDVLEMVIPGADVVFVHLKLGMDIINLKIELNILQKFLPKKWMQKKIEALGGMLHIEIEEQTQYIFLNLPAGGDVR